MKVHFIAIGGSAMHNLAIALKTKGHEVSGSDDAFFDPSKTNLDKHGLLPAKTGWFPEKISTKLDAVILGMHARKDNPELIKAKELGVKIFSYPEYLYEQTKNKKRIIVGGSHGKTTTTLMIMHVLKKNKYKFDYMAGGSAEGFENSVLLSDDSEYAVFEGDEYLTSPIDLVPKFHHYHPDIAIITGVKWDHMNVFPTFENYVDQFRIFAKKITSNGVLIWYNYDEELQYLSEDLRVDITHIPYGTIKHTIENGITTIYIGNEKARLEIFGEHNLQNINAAYNACRQIGVSDTAFLEAIGTFKGANKRLQKIYQSNNTFAFLDFAHSPSKVLASVNAVKEQFPNKKLICCLELHTFSSLSKDFLPQYAHTLAASDKALVYYSPEVVAHKKLNAVSLDEVAEFFQYNALKVATNAHEMKVWLESIDVKNSILLFMTSGTFGGTDLKKICLELKTEGSAK